jgi:hypothetical protein
MANKKISALTALTTPADGDLLPIVDVSDTTDAATGKTKKIALSNFFPASSTDNAIARFDGITGKLLQNSGLLVSDLTTAVTLNLAQKTGAGSGLILQAGDSTDDNGGDLNINPGKALSGNKNGGYLNLQGNIGSGSGIGSVVSMLGGQGGATGAGGAAIVQGGAGGATSGNGGPTYIRGGSATNGNSNGADVVIAPGLKNGSGINGLIRLFDNVDATYGAGFDLSPIASSNKTFTFPNVSGTIATITSGAGVPTGTAPVSIGQIYVDTSAGKVYIAKGVSAGSDWAILN